MYINNPVVVAELKERHEVYEKALLSNDVTTLEGLFWDSPHAVRYGVMENLHGSSEIRAFRQKRPPVNLDRQLTRLEILAVGDSAGIINLEFIRPMDGTERHGRQTQFWFRLQEGWRILSAHVSLLPAPASYLEASAVQLDIPVHSVNRDAVSEDLSRIASIAKFLLDFPLSQSIESAPVFRP